MTPFSYYRDDRSLRMNEHIKHLIDFGAALAAMCSFAAWATAEVTGNLPQIASALTIVWYLWRFYEVISIKWRDRK